MTPKALGESRARQLVEAPRVSSVHPGLGTGLGAMVLQPWLQGHFNPAHAQASLQISHNGTSRKPILKLPNDSRVQPGLGTTSFKGLGDNPNECDCRAGLP